MWYGRTFVKKLTIWSQPRNIFTLLCWYVDNQLSVTMNPVKMDNDDPFSHLQILKTKNNCQFSGALTWQTSQFCAFLTRFLFIFSLPWRESSLPYISFHFHFLEENLDLNIKVEVLSLSVNNITSLEDIQVSHYFPAKGSRQCIGSESQNILLIGIW